MRVVDALKRVFSQYFHFGGRARRSEYWWFQIFVAVIAALNVLPQSNQIVIEVVQLSGVIAGLVLIIPLLSLTSRRLHDIGKSGWWQLLFFGIWFPTSMGIWIFPAWGIFSPRAAESAAIGASFLAAAALCGIIALATLVYWIVWMVRKGETGSNRYGSDPRQPVIEQTASVPNTPALESQPGGSEISGRSPSVGITRITNLDFVRGIATLGILVMNAVSFGLPSGAYYNLAAAGSHTGLDWAVGIFGEIFVDQKMMALFSLLFGASIVLFIDAAQTRGRARPVLLSLRRNLLLLGIGSLHALVWFGDVLFLYALCSPIILLVRNWNRRLLFGLGTCLVLVPPVVALLLQPLFLPDGNINMTTGWATAVGDEIGLGKYWFAEGMTGTATDLSVMAPTVGIFFLVDGVARALGMMFIGVALYRMEILQATRSISFYRRLAGIGILIGLPLAIVGVTWQLMRDFAPDIALVSSIPNTLATIPLALGYIGLLTLWNLRDNSWVHDRVRAVGRMALTNYLTQTIMGITVLRVIFEQGSVSRSGIALFIVCVWVVQLAWSKPWLDRFPYGPFEWAWRKATYRRL